MSATAQPPAPAAAAAPGPPQAPALADGLELLGEVGGSGYKDGAALVRRADGQMVHLGPLMFALLSCIDGRRDADALAAAMCERLGRRVEREHVVRLAQKLADQGLLAGTEANAPPRSNPLLALRWKVLITNRRWTERLTAPFLFLFRPWAMWPILVAFLGVAWFVLIHKGVASATAQVFDNPELMLLVFGLAVASAAFHEVGHATACRYGGATPSGMGAGIYLVWPAFYTDVTDAYRLPRRDRLRVDLGGLFFNTIVAVATLAVWLAVRVDALLLLVALQLLQMVQQLSPIIRADGYHILADATGVPDLYAHIVPTLRRLLPWRRNEPSALTGRARLFVTLWVLVIVPVMLSITVAALLVFPRLVASAWEGGRQVVEALPQDAGDGRVFDVALGILRLFALLLPVVGVTLIAQRVTRKVVSVARSWSEDSPPRRAVVLAATAALVAAATWAWWPSGQYQPIRPTDGGTLVQLVRSVGSPQAVARPPAPPARAELSPGKHLAVALIPEGGASAEHPAIYVIKPEHEGEPATVVASTVAPEVTSTPAGTPDTATEAAPAAPATAAPAPAPGSAPEPAPATTRSAPVAAATPTVPARVFPLALPSKPGPGDTQALAVNTTDGSVKYTVAYAVLTVRDGAAADNTNSAFAFASCRACTTVAVSFQVVLIVGQTRTIAPINVAGALNVDCPACVTTAIADQIVVTLNAEPSDELVARLQADLEKIGALPALGIEGSAEEIAAQVLAVHQEIKTALEQSGLLASQSPPAATATTTTPTTPTATTPTTSTTATTTTPTTTTPAPAAPTTTSTTPTTTTTTTSTTPTTTAPAETTSTTTTETTTTETTPTTTTTTAP